MTNKEISGSSINYVVSEAKQRTWFGHVLCMDRDRLQHAALKLTSPGKGERGRPLGTWRRTVEAGWEELE